MFHSTASHAAFTASAVAASLEPCSVSAKNFRSSASAVAFSRTDAAGSASTLNVSFPSERGAAHPTTNPSNTGTSRQLIFIPFA